MRKIFKYALEIETKQSVELPKGYEILSIQEQDEKAMMWVLVNPDEAQKEVCIIEIYGTGHEIDNDVVGERKHISTFQMHSGKLVFHAFELIYF